MVEKKKEKTTKNRTGDNGRGEINRILLPQSKRIFSRSSSYQNEKMNRYNPKT
jgi:hypothetical protein